MSKSKLTMPIIVTFAIIAFVGGIYFNMQKAKAPLIELNGTYFSPSRDIPQFVLTSSKGQPFTNKNLKGEWSLLFFGFSSCGYICPTILTRLNETYEKLAKMGSPNLPQVVMVSIDPKRDSVERLNEFVTTFNPTFLGARAEENEIQKMTKAFNAVYMKVSSKTGSDENYDIDHTGTVYLLNPEGRLTAIFSMPHNASNMAEDMMRVQKAIA